MPDKNQAAETILIVEDELILAEDMRARMISLGYRVPEIVISGEQALRAAAEERPDLVLMDIKLLGEMDGIEAAEKIRDRYDIPVVYLTALSDDEIMQRAKGSEPFGYVIKPAEMRELRASIEMALYRHRLETKLKEKERWLDGTLRSIGDALIATDEKGQVVFMNPVAERLTGWVQEEALGCDLTDVFHIVNEKTRERAENPVEKVLREGVVAGLANHTLLIRVDGTEIPVDDSGAPIRNEKGVITGVVLVFRDVTERVRAEQLLRESESHYRSIFEDSPVSIWEQDFSQVKDYIDELKSKGIMDFEMYFDEHPEAVTHCASLVKVIDINQVTLKLFQADRKEDILERLEIISDELSIPLFTKELTALAAGETSCLHETIDRTLKGEQIYGSGNLSIMPGHEDDWGRVLVSFEDITERKQAEQALRKSEERLQLALQGGRLGVWDENYVTGEAVYDEGWAEMLGYTLDEIEFTVDAWEKLVHPDDREPVEKASAAHISGETPFFEMIFRMRAKSGEWRWIHSRGQVVERDEDGKPVRGAGIHQDITERVQAEEALRESEERFNLFMEYFPGQAFINSAEGTTVFGNKRICEFYGYTQEEYSGKKIEEITGPEQAAQFLEQDRKILSEGNPIESEEIIPSSYGPRHWLTYKFPIHHKDRMTLIGGLTVDITERVQAEEALRESEYYLKEAQGMAHLGHWRLDPVTEEVTGSDEFFRIFGISQEEATLDAFVEVVHPDDREFNVNHIRRGIEYGEDWDIQHRLICRDGTEKIVHAIGHAITDETGKTTLLLGVVQDITERKRAEEALRESERRLQLALEGGRLGIWDENYVAGEAVYDQGWAKMLGYGLDEIEATRAGWAKLIHPEDRDMVDKKSPIHASPETQFIEMEFRMRAKSGEWRWIHSRGQVTERDEAGKPLRGTGIHQDITERKRAEEALLASQKLAGLGTLAAGIAHEVNSPLQIITGTSETAAGRLRDGQVDEKRLLRNMESINQSAWRVARIIRSLLTYARASYEEIEPNDLNEIIQDTLLMIEHQLRTWSNINVTSQLAEELPILHCERNSIAQVLINLLTNARDAMPRGGEITIRTWYEAQKGHLLLQVTDNGPGIPDDVRSKIFDPFFTTKPVGEGTGLGLSIVMGIVQAHGGEMRVDSEPEQGATFTVSLPEKPPEKPVSSENGDGLGRFDE